MITCGCSKQEVNEIKYLFNNNKRAKEIYKYGINDILKDVFKDNIIYNGGFFVIENVESYGKSVFNNMNTNYACFCNLLKAMNRVLKTQDKDPLSFSGKSEQEQIDEMKLFVSYIHKYRQRIFDKESTIFKQMVASLGVSFNKGENTEIESIDKLYKAFGRENVKKISELANKDDALCGIDALIILDGKENRAQIKPYTTVNYSGNEMEIVESAQVKEYGVELLVFWNKEKLLVFKNNETKIRNGNYVFDSKNLIFAFD